jgi:hypothetical protein
MLYPRSAFINVDKHYKIMQVRRFLLPAVNTIQFYKIRTTWKNSSPRIVTETIPLCLVQLPSVE